MVIYMKRHPAYLLLMSFLVVSCLGVMDIPVFNVDLDAPPKTRWKDVAATYDGSVYVNLINEALDELKIGDKLKPVALKIAGDLDYFIQQPYADEMRGISEVMNISLGDVVLGNIFYDAYTYSDGGNKACTSIVTNNKDGYIIHGRNLDYIMSDLLINLIVHIKYQRGGKTIFEAINFAGQIGSVTSCKPGAFSLTLNARNSGQWWDNAISALEGYTPAFFFTRQVMEKANNYEAALEMLRNMKIISPAYLIVGGIHPYEGAVVIGDRNGGIVERMNNSLQHSWYVVETNYDPWTKPPPNDNRRGAAVKLMNELGEEHTDPQAIYQVLSTPPILQPQTIYTTLMSAKNASIFTTTVRRKKTSRQHG